MIQRMNLQSAMKIARAIQISHILKPSPRSTFSRQSIFQIQSNPRPFSSTQQWRQGESSSGAEVQPPDYLDTNERKIFDMIKSNLSPTKLEVQDVSGGCGSMYALDIVSEQFRGLSVIKQHRMVNAILGDEIKKWHGVQLKTKAP